MRPGAQDTPEPIGVPYGSRARLIMLYLQSEALRTSSREVELGRSLRNWLERMGISVGGKSKAVQRSGIASILSRLSSAGEGGAVAVLAECAGLVGLEDVEGEAAQAGEHAGVGCGCASGPRPW